MSRRTRIAAAASALALAGGVSLTMAAVTASAAPAAMFVPKNWVEVGGINEAQYCADYTPSMGVTPHGDGWQCTLTLTAPTPPGTVQTITRGVNQNDACANQYPADPGVKAYNTAPKGSADPWDYWNCFTPPAAAMRRT